MPTVEVRQATIDRIHNSLAGERGLDDELTREIIETALGHWTNLVLGQDRFRSLTELYLAWLRDLFSIEKIGLDPTQAVLYGQLAFPYGQAGYLARVLREDQPIATRLRYLDELSTALEASQEEAEEATAAGRGTEKLAIRMTKSAHRELSNMLGVLAGEGRPVHPTRILGYMGDYVSVMVTAEDVDDLVEAVNTLSNQLREVD